MEIKWIADWRPPSQLRRYMPRLTFTLILFASVMLLIGCSRSDSNPDDADINEFWAWFEENKDSIADRMKSGDEQTIRSTLGDVDSRMQKITPGVSFLFGNHEDEYEFVVTARGDRRYFANVQSFVDNSPSIDGWKITAFRPPSGSEFHLKIGGISIGAEDIQFQAFDVADGVGITLYPTEMTEEKRDLYSQAAVVILDHVVGEYDAVTKIPSLMVEPASKAEPGVPMRPMTELRDFLNQQ